MVKEISDSAETEGGRDICNVMGDENVTINTLSHRHHALVMLAACLLSGIFLLFSGFTYGAIAYVQQNGTATKNLGFPYNSTAVTIINAPAIGNTIIVSTGVNVSSGGSTIACSDGVNTYSIDRSLSILFTIPYREVIVCSAKIVTVPGTITVTHAYANESAVDVHEFSGISDAPRVDRSNVSNGSSAVPTSNSTSASTESNVLVFGAVEVNGPSSDSFTADGNFPGGPFRTGISNVTLNTQYWITSGAAGIYAYAPTLGVSRVWADAVVTYKAAAVAGIDISGSCKQADQTTNCTDTGTVRVAVNGTLRAQTQPTVSGSWTISGVVAPVSGDVITVYIDGAANPSEAVTVTTYDGTGNITGIELIEEHLTIGSDDNQTISNADLAQYDNSVSGDEDIFHEVNGANDLTVDITGALSAEELYIKSGNVFRPDSTGSGNVTTHDLEINGTLMVDSNSISLNGTWDNNALFTAGTSTVNFTAGFGTEAIHSSGSSFYNISFNDAGGTATYQLESALSVSNDLTVVDGIFDTNSASNYSVTVGNDFLQPGGQVQARSSTLTVGRHFTVDGSESNTGYNSAYLVMSGTASLIYNNLINRWQNGLFDLTVGQSGNITTMPNTRLAVRNQLVVGSGTLKGAVDLFLWGSPNPLVVDANSNIEIDELNFFGNTEQNIPPLINGYDASIRLVRNGTIVTQTSAITINAGSSLILDGEAFVDRSVTYNTNGLDLIVGGDIIIGAGNDTGLKTLNGTNSSIFVGGDFETRAVGSGSQQATFISANSTVTLNGAVNQSITLSGNSFNNLVLDSNGPAYNDGFDFNDAMVDINGNLTINTGWLDLENNNPVITTTGNVTINPGGFIWVGTRTASWIFDGTSLFNDASSGSTQDLQNVVINGGSLTLGSHAKVQTLTNTAGTLNLGSSSYILEIDGTGTPLSNSGTFTSGTSTVKYTGTTTATNIATVPYSSLHLAPTSATTFSLTGDLTVVNAMTGNLTIDNDATLETTLSGDYSLSAVDITINGTYAARGSTIISSGNFANSGIFHLGTSTVYLTETGSITISNGNFWTKPFYNLHAAAATKTTTLGSGIGIKNVLTLYSGVITGPHEIILNKSSGIPLVTSGATISPVNVKYEGNTGGTITVVGTTYNSDVFIRGNASTNNFVLGGNIIAYTLSIYANSTNRTTILDTSPSNYSITLSNELIIGESGTEIYGQLKLNGSIVDVTNGLTINASDASGTNSIDADTANINVAGNWTNNDTFTADTSTVTFDGSSDQTVSGTTTFYNLSKTATVARTLTFAVNSTQTIASGGTITLTGASSNLLTLNCSGCTPGEDHWNLNINSGAFKSIDYVNVSDADASGSDVNHTPINPTNYNDGGSTISWFGSAMITVMKMTAVISDPVNSTTNPKRIPGAVIEYSIVPSNSGTASPDVNTVVITDAVDATNVAFDTTTGVSFTDGTTSSGLALGIVTYSSTTAPGPYVYDYIPGAGYDDTVTSVKVTTTGTFNYGGSPDPGFTLSYRVLIK